MQAFCGAASRGLLSSHRHNPEPAFHCILQRLPRPERRRCGRRYQNGLAGPRVAPGTGWPAPGAEGPESRQLDILAFGKHFADDAEHAVHRIPCSALVRPVRAANRSAISVLFMCSPPAVTPCRSAIPGRHIARFRTSSTTNSRMPRRPAAPGRGHSVVADFADQCAPQRRLYFQPEPQGSLRPTLLLNPDGSLKSNPPGYTAGPLSHSPPCHDRRHAYRLSMNRRILRRRPRLTPLSAPSAHPKYASITRVWP